MGMLTDGSLSMGCDVYGTLWAAWVESSLREKGGRGRGRGFEDRSQGTGEKLRALHIDG